MKRSGKKTKAWEKARAQLKKEFYAKGITSCELRYPRCQVTGFLSWAHRLKRRFILDSAELKMVILVCQNCHRILDEKMSHEEMYNEVTKVIQERSNR